jgi:acylphosphatase
MLPYVGCDPPLFCSINSQEIQWSRFTMTAISARYGSTIGIVTLKRVYLGRGTFATIARLQKPGDAQSSAVETQAKRFFVSGTVQGVGFRFFVEHTAAGLGVGGYVRNLFDGRVEVYAIGSARQLDSLRSALQRGPRMASVERVHEHDAEVLPEHAGAFSIEHSD